MTQQPIHNEIIFYSSPKGNIKVEVLYEHESFWLSQKRMAELFNVEVRTISDHLKKGIIYLISHFFNLRLLRFTRNDNFKASVFVRALPATISSISYII